MIEQSLNTPDKPGGLQEARTVLGAAGVRAASLRAARHGLYRFRARWPRQVDAALDWLCSLECRVRHIPCVRVIGDSHTQVLRDEFPYVVSHVGPATAFNLASATSSTRSWEGVERALARAAERDVILLIFGEIDCRIHVYAQHAKSGRVESVSDIIRRTVERYGDAIETVRGRGYRVVVQSVVGAVHQDNIYAYPFYADIETRGRIVIAFNDELQAWCRQRGVEYLDVFSRVSDSRGIMWPELTTDGTHLDRRALPVYRDWLSSLISEPKPTVRKGAPSDP